jgi:hypothetical protein
MIMSDLDLCNVCWSFVGMSTSSIVKDVKFDHEYLVGFWLYLVSVFC